MSNSLPTLRSQDFVIKDIKQDDGTVEVVQLKGGLAFDESFIAEMKEAGVRKYVDRSEEE